MEYKIITTGKDGKVTESGKTPLHIAEAFKRCMAKRYAKIEIVEVQDGN